ncbi:Transmembrane protein [Phytophthora cinnamomi]|uniref:Transmembrane protein n=1 Tax=Phytophthora cinnamomi TaxID=4785 RepID=UPI0035598E85|nr:Transmembrane protein [Phytophthora cinnamomi]
MFELSTAKDEFVSAYTNKLEIGAGATDDFDRNGLRLGRWSVGLFGCLSDCIPNGFMAFLCPGVSVAQIGARLGLVRYKLMLQVCAALYLLLLLTVAMDSVVLNFFCVVVAVAAASAVVRLRMKMRVLFDIPGNIALDVASVFLCAPCAVAQMANHAQAYKPGTCLFRARSTLEGYVRQ